jgi:hypothetical protein
VRIRITKPPDRDEFAEFELKAFRVGEVFDVPPRLATLLILAGNAEPVPSIERAEAADANKRTKATRQRKPPS